jgi:hypothetical protein
VVVAKSFEKKLSTSIIESRTFTFVDMCTKHYSMDSHDICVVKLIQYEIENLSLKINYMKEVGKCFLKNNRLFFVHFPTVTFILSCFHNKIEDTLPGPIYSWVFRLLAESI